MRKSTNLEQRDSCNFANIAIKFDNFVNVEPICRKINFDLITDFFKFIMDYYLKQIMEKFIFILTII